MKFIRKSDSVDAEQFLEGNPVPAGVEFGVTSDRPDCSRIKNHYVGTSTGTLIVFIGDWIITYSNGTQYAYNDKTFKEMYLAI